MTDLRTRAQALLEKLKGHGRAQVCTLEPSDCREAAAVLEELLNGGHAPTPFMDDECKECGCCCGGCRHRGGHNVHGVECGLVHILNRHANRRTDR